MRGPQVTQTCPYFQQALQLCCFCASCLRYVALLMQQVPDVLIDPVSVTRCFRITKQIGMLATGLPGMQGMLLPAALCPAVHVHACS